MFASTNQPLEGLRSYFPHLAEQVQSPPKSVTGGFSGASVYRIELPGSQVFCLRRWPDQGTSPARVRAIHSIQARAHEAGVTVVPVPLTSIAGSTLCEFSGAFWQVEPWMPGVADFLTTSTDDRLKSAMTHLARFHNAVRDWQPGRGVSEWFQAARLSASPTVQLRLRMITDYVALLDRISHALNRETDARFQRAGLQIIRWFREQQQRTAENLASVARIPVPLQPCIRDLWHDHLLFDGSELSGLVDFGAMATDSVACDLSRLLGSVSGSDVSRWTRAIEHYESIRSLSEAEHRLLSPLDRSGVLLSGMTWLKRRYILRTATGNLSKVAERMESIVARFSD